MTTQEAIQQGLVYEMQDEVQDQAILTKLVPMTDLAQLEVVNSCPWYFFYKQDDGTFVPIDEAGLDKAA